MQPLRRNCARGGTGSPLCGNHGGSARASGALTGGYSADRLESAGVGRPRAAQARARRLSSRGGHGADAVRNNRDGHRSHAPGRARLRHQALPRGGAAQQAGAADFRHRDGSGKPGAARAVAHAARLRRADRHFAQDAARVQDHRKGQPAHVSRCSSWARAARARNWWRARFTIPACDSTSRSCRWIVPGWCPR